VVEHQKNSIARRFEPEIFNPYAGPFNVLEKKFLDIYKVELPENLKVHPIFHVLFFKPVVCDALRPNR
jgi:hypothetical protein